MWTMRVRSGTFAAKAVSRLHSRLVPAIVVLALMALACQLASWARNAGIPESAPRSGAVQNSTQIPVGTILPVRLENTISVKEAHTGEAVETRVPQDVPLPDREKIPMRSIVKGSILSVVKDSDGAGVKVTLKFNQIDDRKQTYAVATSLRAIASFYAVRSAQMSFTGADGGTPAGWATTAQIGGDIRYGDGGKVRNRAKQTVGKGVTGGVLVHVRANPALGCEGPVNGDDQPQALWVFSADACGVYDLKDTKIARTGKSTPIGEITLHFEKDDMKLESGTGMLLRVVSQP